MTSKLTDENSPVPDLVVWCHENPFDAADEIERLRETTNRLKDERSAPPGLAAAADKLEAIGKYHGWFQLQNRSWRTTDDSIGREEFLLIVQEIVSAWETDRGVIEEAYLKVAVDAMLAEKSGDVSVAALFTEAVRALKEAYPEKVRRVHEAV